MPTMTPEVEAAMAARRNASIRKYEKITGAVAKAVGAAGLQHAVPQDFYIAAPGLSTQGHAPDSGQMHFASPFWNAASAAGLTTEELVAEGLTTEEVVHQMQFTKHSFNVNVLVSSKVAGKTKHENKFEIAMKKSPSKVLITIPYLINSTHVVRGAALAAAKSGTVLGNRG